MPASWRSNRDDPASELKLAFPSSALTLTQNLKVKDSDLSVRRRVHLFHSGSCGPWGDSGRETVFIPASAGFLPLPFFYSVSGLLLSRGNVYVKVHLES